MSPNWTSTTWRSSGIFNWRAVDAIRRARRFGTYYVISHEKMIPRIKTAPYEERLLATRGPPESPLIAELRRTRPKHRIERTPQRKTIISPRCQTPKNPKSRKIPRNNRLSGGIPLLRRQQKKSRRDPTSADEIKEFLLGLFRCRSNHFPRALPDVRDGLKAIAAAHSFFAMYELGGHADAQDIEMRQRSSVKRWGNIIRTGTWPFTLRLFTWRNLGPCARDVDREGQGNFGSGRG